MAMADIGLYGLGTMGRALALNLADKGFSVAVSNRETEWIDPFLQQAETVSTRIDGHADLEGFVQALARPRAVLFMIPSGAPLNEMITRILPLLEPGDMVIDGGNADFHETRRRSAALSEQGVHFVGMGVSGGEEGARFGPSLMVGGSAEAWDRLRPMAEAIAARYEGAPCVAHLGPDGAGHFVKTVHNGIEYADMQIIAELYGLMRDQMNMPAKDIGAVFDGWRRGPLASYLLDVTYTVLQADDAETSAPIVDMIEDKAGQKGTGRWTLVEALNLGQSASIIEAAVGARSWSAEQALRMSGLLPRAAGEAPPPRIEDLADALHAARILAHAQGFQILKAASEHYGWALDLARIAEIWRAGCIIRSALLDDIAAAAHEDSPHGHLIATPQLRDPLSQALAGLRGVVVSCVGCGQPVPALSAAVAWYDTLALERGTTNLIQAQRDFFGAHGFARIDQAGKHHGPWHRR